eukprot:s3559_g2.t1
MLALFGESSFVEVPLQTLTTKVPFWCSVSYGSPKKASINETQFRNLLENFYNKGSTWLLWREFHKLSFSAAGSMCSEITACLLLSFVDTVAEALLAGVFEDIKRDLGARGCLS